MPPRIALVLTQAAAACTVLFAAGAAPAQSLESLYDAARAYDANYLAARAQAESAIYRDEQTKALRRPNVSLAGNATRSNTDTPIGRFNNTNTGAQVAGSQPLYNRANSATIDQSERSLAISLADLEAAEQDLIIRLAQAYFDVLGAQDTLATTRGNKAAIAEQLASAKRNFEVGTATITDTREAQARFDLATAQEIAAENDLRNKRNALDTLVGRSGVEPLALKLPAALPSVSPDRADTWVDLATNAPNVRRAQLAFEIAQLETTKARAGHLPTVALVGSVGSSHNSESTGASLAGTTKSAQVGVQLNLPLFAGFAVQNRVKETLALEERSRNDLEAARRGVALATRQAFSSVQSGEASVRALEAAEASNKLALEAIQLGYRVGVRVNLDVLNAQSQLFATQRDLAKARYDLLVGNLRLRQAAGVLKPADVSATSRIVAP
ncbi:MAG TPA: TolC family outer membrane protein [Methylibium sp.]|uniref:TolC family outer membrane protein n=1 Tax=Methylibium sp. TaxID=2067992 RepID=UPI002DBBF6A9|nr:TolC family outer membrane protein [Methylibium sp.]HEU4458085.1 TolC family outer membrane protein [Methylibium sp.]